jgi:WD40 repeat protein
MARTKCKLLFFFVLTSFVTLAGCGSTGEGEVQSSQATETEVNEVIESSDSTDDSTELKDSLTEDQKAYLTEKTAMSSFNECAAEALVEIGFQEITAFSLEEADIEVDGDIDLSIAITDIDGKIVLMECHYMHVIDDWAVFRITDYKNGNCYWAYGDTDKMVDIYDYQTGELISERSDYRSIDEIMEDYDEKSNEIQQNFEDNLDRISDEYNLKR